MTSSTLRLLLVAGAAAVSFACAKTNGGENNSTSASASNAEGTASAVAANNSNPTASAQSAAPAAIASQASIVTTDASGAMQTIRKGTNGWTCMPEAPRRRGLTRCASTQMRQVGRRMGRVTSRRQKRRRHHVHA